MSMRIANPVYFTDPLTGLRILTGGAIRVTMDGRYRVTQPTGGPRTSLTHWPGVAPGLPNSDAPGLPYRFSEIPQTGPLGPPEIVGEDPPFYGRRITEGGTVRLTEQGVVRLLEGDAG